MRGNNTIFINGRHYNAVSGLPIDGDDAPVAAAETHVTVTAPAAETAAREPAKHHHPAPHHSTTLRREFVKKPVGQHDLAAKNTRTHIRVAQSPAISKFAPHPVVERRATSPDVTSHVVAATQHRAAPAQKPAALSSRELKDHLIASKLEAATPNTKQHTKPRRASVRVSTVMAACAAVIVLGAYVSYINMPNLSVRVAAAQSGIDASYPGYVPSGYRFDGPVAYGNGQVTLQFAANGGNATYKITQQKSGWDSQAVLDNFVASKSNDYTINDSQGLTIYTYQNNAAWVNRGVLYTIDGSAPLRTDQVLKIANSL